MTRDRSDEHVCNANPYDPSPGPGGGISLPTYYQPLESLKNNNMYLPGTEDLPLGEMRVTFLGSSPWPPCRLQKGTSMLVELGQGTGEQPRRYFFDMGNGSIGHAIALQVPVPLINDIFISHLHADHYADLPYMYPFRAYGGGFTPLRVYGPSGRIPELGIDAMIRNMRKMNRWHEENFRSCPVGDGMEIEVTEFDYKDVGGTCYEQVGPKGDTVKVIHWPRSHVKDGASAYRLFWTGTDENGEAFDMSFVWTGDGRPDELTAQYAAGADVFVTEGTIDTPALSALKVGSTAEVWEYTMDIYHTPYYAAGYLFDQVRPRIGAICHFEWSGDAMAAESIAEVRCSYDGLWMFGMDLQVINLNKDYVWSREALIGDGASPASPPNSIAAEDMPPVTFPRELQMSPEILGSEIDPSLYYPPDVYRPPTQTWPGITDKTWLRNHIKEGFIKEQVKENIKPESPPTGPTPREMLAARGIDPEAWEKFEKK